jgi:1-acyl-sn-glycerol-3-phosphate acyltransferase
VRPAIRPHSPIYKGVVLPVLRVVAWSLFLLLGPIRVIGRSRLPRGGPLLILPNHVSDVDPVVVQYGFPRPIFFMAKSELFEMRLLGPLIRTLRAFPVNRGEPDRTSIRQAVDLLKAGEPVSVFPEGQLSETGQLQELKPGVALIVRMAGCPVICCHLSNTNRIMPYGSIIPRPSLRRTTVRWGEARTFGKDASTEEIMDWARSQLEALARAETVV